MQLRDRQTVFVDRCVAALIEHGNTLGVAPTGAGKTVMLSAVCGRPEFASGTTLVLQHRDELVAQNRATYETMNPRTPTGLVTAGRKEWGLQTIFAMVPTLARERTLEAMPAIDTLVVDEAHHCAAPSYQKIIQHAYSLNSGMKLLGVTATPNRGDKKALRGTFDNVADQISIRELIQARHLVPPRTFVIDIGVQGELQQVRKRIDEFDMSAAAEIMDKEVLNAAIVQHWKEKAGDRQTVVFCSTVEHAGHVTEAFCAGGVTARLIHGETAEGDRRDLIAAFDRGEFQVMVNVMVLTEGWDCQPVSCVVLLRPSSYKSTMIQMIGRGLRKLDPERYPGRRKDDCIVLDFGTSILTHGGLDVDVDLDQKGTKACPECAASVPAQVHECPICGYEFPRPLLEEDPADDAPANDEPAERGRLENFVMTEVDLFEDSPFQWEGMFNGLLHIASAFDAWSVCIHYAGRWHAVGGSKTAGVHHLADNADRLLSLATADDWMREHGNSDDAGKTRRWLHQPPSTRQLEMLGVSAAAGFGMSRYRASCLLTWKFHERAIRSKLETALRVAA